MRLPLRLMVHWKARLRSQDLVQGLGPQEVRLMEGMRSLRGQGLLLRGLLGLQRLWGVVGELLQRLGGQQGALKRLWRQLGGLRRPMKGLRGLLQRGQGRLKGREGVWQRL
mmetsp:Transcript_19528/g.54329  ORF Transcript_19528/g.54329 Transcript_19528/m.54329 type:complete len:111 (-) Transcript_19528:459-791(-)